MFDGSIDDLEKFLEKYENSSISVYNFDFSAAQKDQNERAKNYLASLYCLARNDKSATSQDSPKSIFMKHPMLIEMWNENENFILKFFKRIFCVGDSNFHGICGWSIQKYQNQAPQMIGIGCYPFISLVNHSCFPNVTRQYFEGKMMLVVERPIGKGDEIFDCYK